MNCRMHNDFCLANNGGQHMRVFECDPLKANTCPKTECYLNGGPCHETTMYPWRKTETNQDKVAEIFRRMDPDALAEILDTNVFVCDKEKCPICKERGFCDKDTLCREVICEWLKEDVKED